MTIEAIEEKRKDRRKWDTSKIVTYFVNTIAIILLICVLLFSLMNALSGPKGQGLFWFKGYTVLSNSMVPTFKSGDYVLDKMVDYDEIKENDVISYLLDGHTIVTHRVNKVTKDGFITKGDANGAVDTNVVTKDMYIAKQIYVVPSLGTIAARLAASPIIICICTLLAIGALVYFYRSHD